MPKTKTLRVTFPERCRRCELCVMESQRQLEKVGLEGALIRISKNNDALSFSIYLDPQVNKLDIEKIRTRCPMEVYTIEERDEDGLFN